MAFSVLAVCRFGFIIAVVTISFSSSGKTFDKASMTKDGSSLALALFTSSWKMRAYSTLDSRRLFSRSQFVWTIVTVKLTTADTKAAPSAPIIAIH